MTTTYTTDWTWDLKKARTDDDRHETGSVLHISGDFGQGWCGQWTGYGSISGIKVMSSDLDYTVKHPRARYGGMTICKRCLRAWAAS